MPPLDFLFPTPNLCLLRSFSFWQMQYRFWIPSISSDTSVVLFFLRPCIYFVLNVLCLLLYCSIDLWNPASKTGLKIFELLQHWFMAALNIMLTTVFASQRWVAKPIQFLCFFPMDKNELLLRKQLADILQAYQNSSMVQRSWSQNPPPWRVQRQARATLDIQADINSDLWKTLIHTELVLPA